MELCKDLTLTIIAEPDPAEPGADQIRIVLKNELEMLEVETCQQINETTVPSHRYHVREAIVIALRRTVSDAFGLGLISDSRGEWKISKPTTKDSSPTEFEIELE